LNIPLYHYDWLRYSRLVDHLFLPALAMARALPGQWTDDKMSALPPGCNSFDLSEQKVDKAPVDRLRLFYVGGVLPPHYDLKAGLDAVGVLDNVSLALCCRRHEWEKAQAHYAPLDSSKIHIVHAFGKELIKYYTAADLLFLIWNPTPYLDFAMPVKIFEALGYGIPIVTNAGTEAARFVDREKIGWVASTTDELYNLIRHLQANPQVIAEKRKHIETVRERHTWLARAQTAARILGQTEIKV
jgi:glycosyltransferase involved in cell wall biosynthesis